MKLKTNRTFTEWPRPKIRNKKNINLSWNTDNQEDQAVIFREKEREREREEKKKVHWRQTKLPRVIRIAPIKRGHNNAFNNMVKRYFWMSWDAAHTAQSTWVLPTCSRLWYMCAHLFFFHYEYTKIPLDARFMFLLL